MAEPDILQCGDTSIGCDQWLAVLDELNIGAFTVDLRHRLTDINQCAQALIGLRAGEILSKDCREVFTGVPCMVSCIVSGGDGQQSEAASLRVMDEERRQHLITRMATPIFSKGRQVVGCLTILQDHSPVSDLIDRLRYEERRLKNILDSLDVGVLTTNRGGLITFFNTAAEQISGYPRAEVLGRSCEHLFDSSDRRSAAAIQEAIARGVGQRGQEGWLRDKEGSSIPIRTSYVALRDEKGAVAGSLATFQDMTLAHQLSQVVQDRYTCFDMIGKSPAMRKLFAMVPVVAASDATVLIQGATGTGKDLMAKIIHAAGPRAGKPWVKINCAAIPDSLIESEIFGYAKGAFTGADRDKPGRFQEADGGTIFLDEIGDLPLSLQAKLLRVLEDKEFYPLGGRRTLKVDVRIISATNRELEQLVKARQFREDLYYRLNVVRIEMPPIKARRDDLPLLIRHILRKLCAARGVAPPAIAESVMGILLNHDYPGNVRELENILEHAMILSGGGPIQEAHLPAALTAFDTFRHCPVAPPLAAPADEAGRIAAALDRCSGHRGKAARQLGMDRTTLWRKMKRHRLFPMETP
jgi:two-component system response regulator HydG